MSDIEGINLGYLRIRNAIVTQAIKDYKKAVRDIKNNYKILLANRTIDEVTMFLKTEYAQSLTERDTLEILKELETYKSIYLNKET
jgi:hypothetical protein